jgi:phosphotransferase system enzyme I (PtsP)
MARKAVSSPRRTLRRIREVMAGPGAAQSRLDRVVGIIAGEMVAEVCSVYVMRAGEVLELFATEGLNPTAVHKTRLRVGEGLVGDIAAHARPLNLTEAQSHPLFAYRAETGEEIFHSFLGVPVVRGGRVRGVLVVQNRTQRHYSDEEVEALEVIAMVLAELIAGGELIAPEENVPAQGNVILPSRLQGVRINPGIAMGEAVLHTPRVEIEHLVAEDPEAELEKLNVAVAAMHSALDDMLASSDLARGGEHRDVLETYRMFAEDRGWLRRIREAIQSGLTVEAAVQKVADETRSRLAEATDPYLRERLSDFEDLSNRLVSHVSGVPRPSERNDLPTDVVLLAHNMGPAELLEYERFGLRALVLEEGSPDSHVAIIARAFDIPVIGQVQGLLSTIDAGDPVIVDADNGIVYVRPGEDIQQSVGEHLAVQAQRRARYAAMRDVQPVTRDGERVSLNINAGLLIDLRALDELGIDGIGLFRTEIPFMVRADFPDVDEQTRIYREVMDRVGDRPVLFRTLDIGGDKRLPYGQTIVESENPALGWRAIRVGLDRPMMLRQQLRALVRAAAGRELSVMFPMVTEVAEFDTARAILDLELAREAAVGTEPPLSVRVGCMLEVPSLVWQLGALCERIDFLSVGSNDLFQFTFAVDRGDPRLADRYDALSPAALAMLKSVVKHCAMAGVPVSVCGEMAARPLDAMALLGIGFRALSVTPAAVGRIKVMVLSLAAAPLAVYLDSLMRAPDHSLRPKLRAFAADHGVVLEDG